MGLVDYLYPLNHMGRMGFDCCGNHLYDRMEYHKQTKGMAMTTPKRITKTDQIKKHFESGRSLSHLECMGLYSTHRLGAYVFILRKKHKMNIVTENRVTLTGAPYARYHLVKEEANG